MRSKLTRRAFVRAGLGSLTALLLLAGQTPPAYASFQDDPTPVDVRAYWPSDYRVTKYRRYDGSLYVKRITKPVDPMAIWEAPPQPGEVHFSREDHFP